MSDIVDDAQEAIERQMETTLALAAENSKQKYKATGRCYYCERELEDGQLYCNEDCADDHAYLIKRQKQNVKVV